MYRNERLQSESMVIVNGSIATHRAPQLQTVSVKHTQKGLMDERLTLGFEAFCTVFGQRFTMNSLQARLVMLYRLGTPPK